MVSKKKREEVRRHLKPYMDDPGTTKDLIPICQRCENWSKDNDPIEWCEDKEKCPVFQLWLSNEYLEWFTDEYE